MSSVLGSRFSVLGLAAALVLTPACDGAPREAEARDGADACTGHRRRPACDDVLRDVRGGRSVTLSLGPNAVARDVPFTIRRAPARRGPVPRVPVLDIGPSGTVFAEPAVLCIDPAPADLPWILATDLRIATAPDGATADAWETLPAAPNAPVHGACAYVRHLSLFTLVPAASSAPVRIFDVTATAVAVGPVTLGFSAPVHVLSAAVSASRVDYIIEAAPATVQVTLGGLAPGRDVYVYDGGIHGGTVVHTDAGGGGAYAQALAGGRHGVMVVAEPGTIVIDAVQAGGGGCAAVGMFDAATRTCLLAGDVDLDQPGLGTLQISSPQTTLDCAGHRITKTGPGIDVTIAADASGAAVIGCDISTGQNGIVVFTGAAGVRIDGNVIAATGAAYGLLLFGAGAGAVIQGNQLTGVSGAGVRDTAGATIAGNTFATEDGLTIFGSASTGNSALQNDIVTLPVTPPKVGAGLVLASGAHDNEAAGNNLTGAGEGYGILHEDAGTAGNVLTGNAIRGYGDGIRFIGDGGALVRGCIVEGNDTALRFDASASPATRVTANDITGSAPPQVTAAIAIELSDAGTGNYWGHDCAGGPPYFDPAADSDNPLAADSHPYGIPVAALQVPPAPPGCAPAAVDADGDGYASIASGGDDCDDLDPTTYPGAFELCDNRDNDCDTVIDEGACGQVAFAAQPPQPGSWVTRYWVYGPVEVTAAGFSDTVEVPPQAAGAKFYLVPPAGATVGHARLILDGSTLVASPPISRDSRAMISPPVGAGAHDVQVSNFAGTVELIDERSVCDGRFVEVNELFPPPDFVWPPPECTGELCGHGPPPPAPCPDGGIPCPIAFRLDFSNSMPEVRMVVEKDISRPGTMLDIELRPSGRQLLVRQELTAKRQAKILDFDLAGDTHVVITRHGDPNGSINVSFVDIDMTPPQGVITQPVQGFVTDQSQVTIAGSVDDEGARVTVDGIEIPTFISNSADFIYNAYAATGPNFWQICAEDMCGGLACGTVDAFGRVVQECSVEICNGFDDDCNGIPDDNLGSTTCGVGACQRTQLNCLGGQPQTCVPGTREDEVCDGIDNNCDGRIDDGFLRDDGRWISLGPEGGVVKSIAVSASTPAHVVAGAYRGGVYTSRTAGEEWSWKINGLPGPEVRDVEIDPNDPEVIYAATTSGAAYSPNFGDNWLPLNGVTGSNQQTSFTSRPGDSSVYAVTTVGFFKTQDSGSTWTQAFVNAPALIGEAWIGFSAADPQLVLLSSRTEIHRSLDDGITWSQVYSAAGQVLPARPRGAVVVEPNTVTSPILLAPASGTSPLGRWAAILSNDGGTSWVGVKSDVAGNPGRPRPSSVAILEPDDLLVGGVWLGRSRDGGQTWTLLWGNFHPDVLAITVDWSSVHPTRGYPERAYLGTDGGVFVTEQLGSAMFPPWAAKNNRLFNTIVTGLAVSDGGSTIVLSLHDWGWASVSTDGGCTWSWGGVTGEDASVYFEPGSLGTIYAIWHAGQPGGILKSMDGGLSFSSIDEGLEEVNGRIPSLDQRSGASPPLLIQRTGQRALFFGGAAGVFKSTNGGANWLRSDTGLPSGPVVAMAMAPSDNLRIYVAIKSDPAPSAAVDSFMAHTLDGGVTWTLGAPVFDAQTLIVHPSDPDTVFVGTFSEGVLRSADRGQTWQSENAGLGTAPFPGRESVSSMATTELLIYVAARELGVFRSGLDGPIQWTPVTDGYFAARAEILHTDPVYPEAMYMGTRGQGLLHLVP